MGARIRGHYRIDSAGRVKPVADVNAEAKPYTLPLSRRRAPAGSMNSHLRQFVNAGLVIAVVGVGLLAMLPKIGRLIMTEQARQIASIRADYIQQHPALETLLKHR